MKNARLVAWLMATAAAGTLTACGPKQVRTPEPPPDPKTATLVMLLPDSEGGTTGRAAVSSKTPSKTTNKPASVELASARESTLVGLNGTTTKVAVLSDEEVQKQFGSLLSSLPPAAQHFILYFRFESDELTAESRALVPEILRAVKERPVPEVVATGHTDTTGTPASNYELGMKRATMVRALLAEAGLDPASIEVTSHGEAALLVRTPDDTYEPRNRRVEITIR
jgi:outer membrane protein OmpA-like peptidoglycan-associated protein